MKAGIQFWWYWVSAAARATLTHLGSKKLFALLLIEVCCAAAAFRAYRAPQGHRWAALRSQWMFEIRDVFIVIFAIVIAVFGWELMWNQPNQSRLQQLEESRSNSSALFDGISINSPLGSTNAFLPNGNRPICVEVPLPQGFPGGSYKLPFKPAAPSPPALYINGSPQRKGVDYTVSDSTIVVNFRPESKDSLSVWYTTNDPFARILPKRSWP
jgi:hypothetical protein